MSQSFKIEDHINIQAGSGKLYLAIKDGKSHSIGSLKQMLKKAGVHNFWGCVNHLQRILRQAGKTVARDHVKGVGTVKLVAYKKPTNKPQSKTAKAIKPQPKIVKAKPATPKVQAKKPAPKPKATVAAIVHDDDAVLQS